MALKACRWANYPRPVSFSRCLAVLRLAFMLTSDSTLLQQQEKNVRNLTSDYKLVREKILYKYISWRFRSIPYAILASLTVCLTVYVTVSALLTLVVPYDLIDSESPLTEMFRQTEFPQVNPSISFLSIN